MRSLADRAALREHDGEKPMDRTQGRTVFQDGAGSTARLADFVPIPATVSETL
jgi:hypothetical protein